jgi:hypothetical protein
MHFEMAGCRLYQSRGVARITLDCLLQEVECPDDPVFFPRKGERESTQVQILCSDVAGRSLGRSADFRSSQCRFDDPSHTDRHLVLQLENIFEGAVEALGPQMRAGFSLNQLRRDAHSAVSARLLEHPNAPAFAGAIEARRK